MQREHVSAVQTNAPYSLWPDDQPPAPDCGLHGQGWPLQRDSQGVNVDRDIFDMLALAYDQLQALGTIPGWFDGS